MENGQKTLSELFENSTFTVPVYQRAYAWEERQCEDFLRDLEEHPEDDGSKRHFLGTVLLAAKPPGDFRSRFDVVDGQQRLTTTTIFAVVAVARMAEDESLRFRANTFRSALLVGGGGERLFHTILDDEGFLERFVLGGERPGEGDFLTSVRPGDSAAIRILMPARRSMPWPNLPAPSVGAAIAMPKAICVSVEPEGGRETHAVARPS